jgi:hypothetical protein
VYPWPAAGPDGVSPAEWGEWPDAGAWAQRARRQGPLRYSQLGRRRLRPPDPGQVPDLAGWLAGAADRWWADAGRPDPYTLAVVSGDAGTLARAVRDRRPGCAAALRYVLVDWDRASRAGSGPGRCPTGGGELVLEDPVFTYPADFSAGAPDADGELQPARGLGPLFVALSGLPPLRPWEGAVVAVQVLSRLPFDLYRKAEEGWVEIRLGADGDGLSEVSVPAAAPAGLADRPGTHVHWSGGREWLARRLAAGPGGALAVVEGQVEVAAALASGLLAGLRPPDLGPYPVGASRLSVLEWRLS